MCLRHGPFFSWSPYDIQDKNYRLFRKSCGSFRRLISMTSGIGAGSSAYEPSRRFGMMFRWLPHRRESVYWMHTDFPASGLWNRCAAYSVTRRRGSSRSCAAQKNPLRGVWPRALGLVRPQDTSGPRPALRELSGLSAVRSSACVLPQLPSGEARGLGVLGREPLLHEALCLLRGAALPQRDHQGHRAGAAP